MSFEPKKWLILVHACYITCDFIVSNLYRFACTITILLFSKQPYFPMVYIAENGYSIVAIVVITIITCDETSICLFPFNVATYRSGLGVE